MKKLILVLALIFLTHLFSGCSTSNIYESNSIELEYPKKLKIVKRSEWGWKPITSNYPSHEIKYITVHHGGVEFPRESDPVKHISNLQSWSRNEKKWIDIPYHYMIDLDGIIYEARPINIPGDTNTEYDPTDHVLVEIMGNYEIQELNKSQLSSMVDLIYFLATKFNVEFDKVKTHKDYSENTVCPGKNLYEYFSTGRIEKMLGQKKSN